MPRLLRFIACQVRLRSSPGISSRNGSILRPAAPAGGSTTTTSAPSAARMLPASIVSGAEISTTRISSSIGTPSLAASARGEAANYILPKLAAHRFQVERGRIEKALDRQSTQSPDDHRGLRIRLRIAANLAGFDALLDQLANRAAKVRIRRRHVAADFRHGTERLPNQYIQRIAITGGRGSKISLHQRHECREPLPALYVIHFMPRKTCLRRVRDRAHQRFLGAEAMSDQAIAVTREFADLRKRGAAAALPFDQLD